MSDKKNQTNKVSESPQLIPGVEREHIDVMLALEHHMAMRKYSPAIINSLAASYAVG